MNLINIELSLTEIVAIAGACLIGFIVCWVFFRRPIDPPPPPPPPTLEEFLAEIFGTPVYAVSFSLKEANNWIKARQDKLTAGNRAVICKINSTTMSMLGHELSQINIDIDAEKFLVIAIISNDSSKDIIGSLLVKYEKLSENLEAVLSKSNGMLIVEA